MTVDRTSEFQELVQITRTNHTRKQGSREFDKSPQQRWAKSVVGEAFGVLSEQTMENLRQFALLLHASSGWFVDARNYDCSSSQRAEFEASCTKLLQGLLANLVALRDLAEWPRGRPVSSARTQHRLAVVEAISKQVDELNQYLRKLLSISGERSPHSKAIDSFERSAIRENEPRAWAPTTEVARLGPTHANPDRSKHQDMENVTPTNTRTVDFPRTTELAEQQMVMQAPVLLWENELAERDRFARSIERRMIEVSQLLYQFSVQVAQQDHLVDSLLEDAHGATTNVERANLELDRLRSASHSWHTIVTVMFLVMALSLLALDWLK
ncbi:hypothetical protein F1559_004245 [Cyanidiococcus yangmingshanensis]|uniref:t-SNARE coiled-coil homology domain-containing protein n=1 Tax=Cyanidiococcus yangmingshanensis TaxID=2690220 RepID=A0A7J7IK94_9RHOD|nr:hypothetical protein F1559_004245 [Cyanidiococcus yangmingshanensis]